MIRCRSFPRAVLYLLIIHACSVLVCLVAGNDENATTKWWSPLPSPSPVKHTSFARGERWKLYKHLWVNQYMFRAFLPPDSNWDSFENGMTSTNDILTMPVTNATDFAESFKVGWVPGVTLLIDFPFLDLHPHEGHWLELMAPLMEAMKAGEWAKHTRNHAAKVDNIMFTNLYKANLTNWYMHMLVASLSPGRQFHGANTDKILEELESEWRIIDRDMLGHQPHPQWVMLETVLVVTDRYTHGKARHGFIHQSHGHLWDDDGCQRFINDTHTTGFENTADDFRDAILTSVALKGSKGGAEEASSLPRTITLISDARGKSKIENMGEVVDMLWEVARPLGWKVRPFSASASMPMTAHISQISKTGLLIGEQSHLMANAVFLPPGAAVVEFIPFNTEWLGITQLNYNLTQCTKKIHHFAWRATESKWAVFSGPKGERYKTWLPEECTNKDCLTAYEKAGLVVDTEAVKKLLESVLPQIIAGQTVEAMRRPWPSVDESGV